MNFYVGTDKYSFQYFPFFRVHKNEDFHVYGMRLPSGKIEEVLVFDHENPIQCLKEYSEFLVTEYVLEDDIMLTQRALELKLDLKQLLGLEDEQ